MSAPTPSRLDANQVLQGSFDEATGRLRTDSTATIVNADIDVALDSTEDSVAIANSAGDFLAINADGSINVVVSGTAKELISLYLEVTGIVSGITTLVASYTAIANTYLQKVEFSGTNIAEYELVIDGVTQDKKRTYFGNSLNGNFDFGQGLEVPSGDIIGVYVVHTRPDAGDFNARIQILQG